MDVNTEDNVSPQGDNEQLLAAMLDKIKIQDQLITGLMKKRMPEPIDPSKYPNKDEGFYSLKIGKNGPVSTPDYHGLADYVRDEFKIISSDAYVYLYENGYYHYCEKGKIISLLDRLTKGKIKPPHINQFYQMIMMKTHQSTISLRPSSGCVNLHNGILQVKDRRLIPHSPHFFFKYKLPHIYDPKADCPRFKEFLSFIFEGNNDAVEATAEIFGYCLLGGEQRLDKAFVLFGEGRNGKSTWLRILTHLLGDQNICSVSLANLTKPFSVVNLDGKLANILEETPSEQINAEAFKTATSGGKLVAAHKGKPEYEFNCYARFLFATNKIPVFNESTIGLKERLYFLKFGKFIEENQRDNSFETIIKEREMSGIINFALEGLDRLLKRGHLPTTASHEEMMDEFKSESDSVYEYYKDRIEVDFNKDGFLPTEDLYEDYKKYALRVGRRSVGKNQFSRRLASAIKSQHGESIASQLRTTQRDRSDDMNPKKGFRYVYIRSSMN